MGSAAYRKRVLAIACLKCGALPGHHCVDLPITAWAHRIRMDMVPSERRIQVPKEVRPRTIYGSYRCNHNDCAHCTGHAHRKYGLIFPCSCVCHKRKQRKGNHENF